MSVLHSIVWRRTSKTSKPNVVPVTDSTGKIPAAFIPATAATEIESPDGNLKFTLGNNGMTQVEDA